jgi:type IX secretion system PorP/SprF family membrane protein
MKRVLYIALIVILANSERAWSQDFHFSQYKASPLGLNPAFAGFMDGNLRIAGNYRNQWFSVSSFSTYAFSVDGNIARSGMKYNMLGLGASFFQDIEEKNGLTNTNISLTTAYNIKLTKSPLQYLGVGVQPSLIRKQVNLMDAVYGTLFETGINNDPLGFSEYGGFKFDLNFGLNYFIFFGGQHIISAGFSLYHVNQPDFGVLATDVLYRKYVTYLLTELEVGYREFATIGPNFYFTKQGPSIEFMPGLMVRFRVINAINDIQLAVGASTRFVGHRTANLAGTDFIGNIQLIAEQFTFGFSYDVAVSELKNATGRNGGPEISILLDLGFENRNRPRNFRMMRF